MNRRGFIRSAAGVLIAAGAGQVLTPERTVWALDRTMIAPEELMRRHAVRESRLARAAWLRGDMEAMYRHTDLANLIAADVQLLENAKSAADYLKRVVNGELVPDMTWVRSCELALNVAGYPGGAR